MSRLASSSSFHVLLVLFSRYFLACPPKLSEERRIPLAFLLLSLSHVSMQNDIDNDRASLAVGIMYRVFQNPGLKNLSKEIKAVSKMPRRYIQRRGMKGDEGGTGLN